MQNDYQIVNKFMLQLERENLSRARIQKYAFMIKELKKLGISPERIEQKNVDCYFFYLLKSDYSDETKSTKWVVFKRFCKFNKFDVELSHRIKVREKIPEILTYAEMELLFSSLSNFKYKLFFMLLYESGCRSGELLNLSKENVFFDSNGAIIVVNGKTGFRPVRIIYSSKYLRQYIESIGTGKLFDFSNVFANRVLKQGANIMGINKNLHCHIFRHTKATELSKFLTDREMCLFFGWSKNSRMPSHYSHLSFRDLDAKILELNGISD